jgi:hypothetical protein
MNQDRAQAWQQFSSGTTEEGALAKSEGALSDFMQQAVGDLWRGPGERSSPKF